MKIHKYIFIFLGLLVVNKSFSKMIEYVEDIYLLPAPNEITNIVSSIMDQQNFDQNYEVAIPKKSGMQINPWNQFISSGINPITGNLFFIINPDWFSQLNKDEQSFLITRAFFHAKSGGSSIYLKIIPWLFIIISILLMILLVKLLGKCNNCANLNLWLRILIAWVIMFILNLAILNRIQLKVSEYFAFKHNLYINDLAIKNSGVNKEIAISALTKIDSGIKADLKNGNFFWKPFETLFEKQVEALKNK